MGWAFSDYTNYERSDSTRLERLRLHIVEVEDKLASLNYSVQGKSHSSPELGILLGQLRKERDELEAALAPTTTARTSFTRVRPT